MRVLIVEDEALLAMSYKMSLEGGSCEVVGIAVTAQEAISLSRSESPEVVLMDIKLQGNMDGIDAARTIMESLNLQIVFITGNADEKTKERALSVKPRAYLEKPIDCDKLQRSLCDDNGMDI